MSEDPLAPAPPGRTLLSSAQVHHVLRVEFGRARRHAYPLACLVIAVDRLERLRDRLGYEAKERVLDAVVSLLRGATRSSDAIGRTPDDRLIVVVPHVQGDGAKRLGQRVLDLARTVRVDRIPEPFPVTLTIGAASTRSGATLYHDALLAAAEAAYEEAAAAGGDRFAERESAPPQT